MHGGHADFTQVQAGLQVGETDVRESRDVSQHTGACLTRGPYVGKKEPAWLDAGLSGPGLLGRNWARQRHVWA